jgi:hypothetical protein
LINSIQRSVEWKPPQQTKTNTPSTQTKVTSKKDKKDKNANKSGATPAPQTEAEKQAEKKTKATLGTSNARPNPGVNNADNKDGPLKQKLLQSENTAKLQFQTLMVPVLTGIKPNDIVYIPSFTGTYIEDWIVQSVDYSQTDGGVEISVSATRTYGVGDMMVPSAGEKFKTKAKKLKTLEDWENYAWELPGSKKASAPDLSGNPQSSRGYGDVVDY